MESSGGKVWYGVYFSQLHAPGLKMCTNYVCWILYACDAHDVICKYTCTSHRVVSDIQTRAEGERLHV